MTLKVQHVEVEYTPQLFAAVEKFIADGLDHTDDCNVDQVKVMLANGAWRLLVATDEQGDIQGAYVMALNSSMNDRTAVLVSAAGKGLASQDAFDQVCDIAKMFGATRIQALARESAARLYKRVGLTEKATLMEKRLWAA
jgi:hypothetical protein